MWEKYAPIDRKRFAAPYAPSSARKIAEAVDRHCNGFLKRRDMEGGRKMREMVLDRMDSPAKALAGKYLFQKLGCTGARLPVSEPLNDKTGIWKPSRQIV
jgi:hypothetical protein